MAKPARRGGFGSGARRYTRPINVLFLCTGNICRSPAAEALLTHRLVDLGADTRVRSAGLLAAGNKATVEGVEVLAARGLDIGSHRSRKISREILLSADLIVGMAREHVREAVVVAPEAWPRTFTLKELVRRAERAGARSVGETFEAWLARVHAGRSTADLMGTSTDDDVADPIGQPRATYERMVEELDDLLGRLVVLAWAGALQLVPAEVAGAGSSGDQPAPALPLDDFEPAEAARAMAAAVGADEQPDGEQPDGEQPAGEQPADQDTGATDVGVEVEPVAPAGVEPVAPAGVEPVAAAEVEPVAAAEVEPVAAAEVEPVAAAAVEPVTAAEVEPVPLDAEPLRVAIGADHAGVWLKAHLVAHLGESGHVVTDLGTHTEEPVDYADFGAAVGRAVAHGEADVGVCVCGTGIGTSMAANTVAGVRAAVVHDVTSARLARQHNDANVVCVGARLLGLQAASDAVDAFVAARFEGGRHRQRLDRLAELETTDTRSPAPVYDDHRLFGIIAREIERQNTTLQLIASENFTSPAVMAAQGSVLTNKYSEGYPRKRYYGGNFVVDEAEELARDRVKALFGAEHANVQPHSGANANMAVYLGLLEPGDTVLGMRLDQGGHLTHGSPVNFSGKLYHFVSYGVTESDERLDYDQIRDLARQERPKAIIAGATAYPRVIDPEPLRAICDEVGALFIFDAAHVAGLIAGGVHPNPVPYADVVTFTTHKTLRGPRAGCIVCREEHAKAIDKAVFPGLQGGPLMHVIAAKAVAFREAAQPEFRTYAAQVVTNARALAKALAGEGFRLVSGGTDNHLMLVDLRPFDAELTGKEAQEVLDRAGITLNKNQIPGDPRSPFVTSGLRIGTAAMTTAGMREAEMAEVAALIGDALRRWGESGADPAAEALDDVHHAVTTLCSKFTPYPELA